MLACRKIWPEINQKFGRFRRSGSPSMQLPRVAKFIARTVLTNCAASQDHMARGLARRRERRREQFVCGRLLARQLLEQATGVSREDWTFATDSDGRPLQIGAMGMRGPIFPYLIVLSRRLAQLLSMAVLALTWSKFEPAGSMATSHECILHSKSNA